MIRTTGLAEQGLFSRLQGYFSSSFGGRYVEHLIKETIRERPQLAQRLFGISGLSRIEVEHRFQVNGATRVADMAFFSEETGHPVCLVEIKYDDHKSPGNAAQLYDYLRYLRLTRGDFVYLTQHLPPEPIRHALKRSGRRLVLFSDLADRLQVNENSIEGLLRRFFVDKGLVMHGITEVEYGHLRSFMFRFFNPYRGGGRTHTKEGMGGAVADVFGDLLRNMNIIARQVTSNLTDYRREPTIDFWAEPYVNARRIRRQAENSNSSDVSTDEARAGGCLWIYARSPVVSDSRRWLILEFGFCLEVQPNDRTIYLSTFGQVISNLFDGEGAYSQKPAGKSVLSDKNRATRSLKQRLQEVIDEVPIRQLPRRWANRLAAFRKAVGT